MSRLVDADDVKKRGDCYPQEVRSVISNILRHTKTIKDVAPVKRGQWLGMEYDGYADGCPVYDTWACSECEYEVEGDADVLTNFCPNCGAKMDEVSE